MGGSSTTVSADDRSTTISSDDETARADGALSAGAAAGIVFGVVAVIAAAFIVCRRVNADGAGGRTKLSAGRVGAGFREVGSSVDMFSNPLFSGAKPEADAAPKQSDAGTDNVRTDYSEVLPPSSTSASDYGEALPAPMLPNATASDVAACGNAGKDPAMPRPLAAYDNMLAATITSDSFIYDVAGTPPPGSDSTAVNPIYEEWAVTGANKPCGGDLVYDYVEAVLEVKGRILSRIVANPAKVARGRRLGEGQFGVVTAGVLQTSQGPVDVAIKMVQRKPGWSDGSVRRTSRRRVSADVVDVTSARFSGPLTYSRGPVPAGPVRTG